MKQLLWRSLLPCLLVAACSERESSQSNLISKQDNLESIQFPILIERGSKAVYRFGKMTPRGLKYFFDTVDVNGETSLFPDSLKVTFLSPLSMSGEERENVPAIIAISVPGLWEGTIFGKIDSTGQLYINYLKEIDLSPANDLVFKPGEWSAVFRNDSTTVRITAMLSETKFGDHLAGKGKLFLQERNKLMEEVEVFLVYNANRKVIPSRFRL